MTTERNRGGSIEQLGRPLAQAAQMNLEAARTLGTAARELSNSLRGSQTAPGGISGRWKDETAAAVASGVLFALRRAQQDPLIGPGSGTGTQPGLPRGASYGRMGASVTGRGERSQSYGAIGGMIGYAVGGPVGGLLGGMLGGLFGRGHQHRSKSALQRNWLNTPEEFEIQSYLYNLRRAGAFRSYRSPVRVNKVEINITGQGAEAGLEAGRTFATYLGQQVALNSAVAQAPGYGGEM